MMRQVPFYPNRDDDVSCVLACYRSILDYFIHRNLSWDELEAFTGFEKGKAVWTPQALTHFTAMGFEVRMIEPFDYHQFAEKGTDYFKQTFPSEQAEWYIKETSWQNMAKYIPKFVKAVDYDCRNASLQDIDGMLANGMLVFLVVNSKVLNNQEGYLGHIILVLDKVGDQYIAHDPGLPPQPHRQIDSQQLEQAMSGSATGFKLKERRNLRLDQYVISRFPLLSRAYAVRLIDEGKVLVNGKTNKAGYKVRERDEITIDYDDTRTEQVPEIDLPILYEDDDVIVINKPAGVLTHSVGKLHGEATVATFIRSRLHSASPNDPQVVGIRNSKVNQDNTRAGIVHRLDRATSGVIICAKNAHTLSWLQKQFHDRHATKTYAAVIKGQLEPTEAVIDMPIERNPKAPATFRVGINGKPAVTAYKTLDANETHSLLELKPRTGRTHQLRVHLAYQHHPIVGDYMYDGQKADRLYLHAWKLSVTLPNGEAKTFEAPLPQTFREIVR